MSQCQNEIGEILDDLNTYFQESGVFITVFILSILCLGKFSFSTNPKRMFFSIYFASLTVLCIAWSLMGTYNFNKLRDRSRIEKAIGLFSVLLLIIVGVMYYGKLFTLRQKHYKILYSPISTVILQLAGFYFLYRLISACLKNELEIKINDKNIQVINEFETANRYNKNLLKFGLGACVVVFISGIGFVGKTIQKEIQEEKEFLEEKRRQRWIETERRGGYLLKGLKKYKQDTLTPEEYKEISNEISNGFGKLETNRERVIEIFILIIKILLLNFPTVILIIAMVVINRGLEEVEDIGKINNEKIKRQLRLSITLIITSITTILIVFCWVFANCLEASISKAELTLFVGLSIVGTFIISIPAIGLIAVNAKAIRKAKRLLNEGA